jgi:hypothetical protein
MKKMINTKRKILEEVLEAWKRSKKSKSKDVEAQTKPHEKKRKWTLMSGHRHLWRCHQG